MSHGGSNARFRRVFAPSPDGRGTGEADTAEPLADGEARVRACAIVSDLPDIAHAVAAALGQWGVACHRVDPVAGFEAATGSLTSGPPEPLDALVVALSDAGGQPGSLAGWERVLQEHGGLVDSLQADSTWAFAAAAYAASADRPVRLVTLTEASTAGGRSRAQAAAQAARVAATTTKGRITAFAAAIETSPSRAAAAAGALVAHLLQHPAGDGLAGAELAVGDGWIGLRSHPGPAGSVCYGGPAVPSWVGAALHDIAGQGQLEAP